MTHTRLATAAALILIGSVGLARADEEKIPVAKLPAAVKKAVRAKFPKAKITAAAKETEEGEPVYEVSLTFKGDTYDLSVEPDGEIAEIERAIEVEDLPRKVVAGLKARYPKAKLTKAEELTRDDVVSYEVTVAVGKKEPVEVAVSRKGKIAKAKAKEEDDEKDEKGVKSKKDKKDVDEDDDDEKEMKAKKGKTADRDGDDDDEKEMKAKKGKTADKDGDDDDDDEKEMKAKKGKTAGKDKDADDDDENEDD